MPDEQAEGHETHTHEAHSHATHAHEPQHTHEAHSHAHTAKKSTLERLGDYKWHALAFILYLVVSLVIFYPITLNIGTHVRGAGGDAYQNLWFFWWSRYAVLTLHTNVFQTFLLYYPLGTSLIYQTMPPLLGLVFAPLQFLNLVFAYNVMFFLGFALSGVAMFLLADYIVKDKRAAFIAGIIFAFSAFHFAQSSHIHFINIEWAPLFVYFLLRTLNERNNYWNIIGLSASFALSTLAANIEQSIIILVFLPLLAIYYLAKKEHRYKIMSRWFAISMVLFVIIAFIMGSWNYIPIINAARAGGLSAAYSQNTPQYNAIWSDSLLAYLVPSYFNGIAYRLGLSQSLYNTIYAADPSERAAYIGYSVLLLALYGIYKNRKDSMLWLVGAVIFGWLALGPVLQLFNVTGIPGIFLIYHSIPFFNIVREPGRFQLMFTLSVAILAAFGFRELMKKTEEMKEKANVRTYQIASIFVISVIILMELSGIPLGGGFGSQITVNATVPPVYNQMSSLPGNFSVVSLPALPVNSSTPYLYAGQATYYITKSHKALVGGYLGRTNVSQYLLLYNMPLIVQASNLLNRGSSLYESPVQQNYTNETLLTLFNYNTAFIVVQKAAYNQTQLYDLGAYLYGIFGTPAYNDNSVVAFGTIDALNRSIYRSYVSYPLMTEWNYTVAFVNGSYQQEWYPISPGEITVYAPYSNSSQIGQYVYSQSKQYIQTQISFSASSSVDQVMYIGEATPGADTYSILGSIQIGQQPQDYDLNLTLLSGPQGNKLLFISNYTRYPVFMRNLTFSRARG